MKKKILILGSAGQIGSHLTNFLRKKKYTVSEFDIENTANQDLRKIKNKELIKAIKKNDFVYFLAFDVGGSRYLKKYEKNYDFLMNNQLIMINVFSLLKNYKKKFIFASSQMSNMHFSNYGVLKKIGESLTESINGISVRFWNVYGIEYNLKKSHVITDLILKGFKNRTIKLLTNGEESREFLYAEDCCIALEVLMKKYSQLLKNNKQIDLTTHKLTKIIQIAKIIEKKFESIGKKVKFIPSASHDSVQLNKKNKGKSSIKNYWKPKFTLEAGISEVFNFYNQNYKKFNL